MPIYEYRCGACKRRVSLFFRTFSSAESGAAEATCPNCGAAQLSRLVSKVSLLRGAGSPTRPGPDLDADPQGFEPDSLQEEGEWMNNSGGMPGLDEMMAGVDEEDPRSIARWARQMQNQMGEDLGPEFNTALTRIEKGEDPDHVLDDMDPGMGMPADDGGGDFDE